MIVYLILQENNLLFSNRLTDLNQFGFKFDSSKCFIGLVKIENQEYIREINESGASFFTERKDKELKRIIEFYSKLK